MSAIVNSIHLPQQKFFVVQEKLGDTGVKKSFLQQENFSTPQKFFLREQKLFRKKFLFNKKIFSLKKIFCSLQNLILQHQKTFSEKFSDITHITHA